MRWGWNPMASESAAALVARVLRPMMGWSDYDVNVVIEELMPPLPTPTDVSASQYADDVEDAYDWSALVYAIAKGGAGVSRINLVAAKTALEQARLVLGFSPSMDASLDPSTVADIYEVYDNAHRLNPGSEADGGDGQGRGARTITMPYAAFAMLSTRVLQQDDPLLALLVRRGPARETVTVEVTEAELACLEHALRSIVRYSRERHDLLIARDMLSRLNPD